MSLKSSIYFIKKIDWVLIAAALLLCLIGLLAIYSLSQNGSSLFLKKQILFVVVGFFLMLGLSFLDYRNFKNHSSFLIFLYIFSLLILGALLFWGQQIRGSVSWFYFKGFGFEPVELSLLVIILVLAKYFSLRHIEMYRIRHLLISFFYIILPSGLIVLQSDLGSALIFFVVWLGLIIVSGIKIRHLIIIILIGAILSGTIWSVFLKEYQKQRILTFLNPQKDPQGYSYQLQQSMIAVGSGGFFGKGLREGSQSQLKFLPERETDFIFATIAEEWGLFGILFIFFLFGVIMYRILRITFVSDNNFSRLFATGFALILITKILINTGMNMGILPIIGISLPFISYGGSAMLINFIGLGILQSIKLRSSLGDA